MRIIQNLFQGAFNRSEFFTRIIITALIFPFLYGMFLSFFPGILDEKISFVLSAVIAGAYVISISIKRLHDLEKSELLVLFLLFPGVNLLFLFYLLFFKGKPQTD
jgi:uncharacterized membrane protein YhaH (DUF805 family)